MTQEEIIELAKQAGFLTHPKNTYIISKHASADEDLNDELETFAKLVAEKEREACAKIADEWVAAYPHPSLTIAEWIRKREQA